MSKTILTKICSKCQVEKPISEFYKARDSVRGDCKKCRDIYNKAYQQKNRASLLEYHKKYNKEHALERAEYHKKYMPQYHKDNKDKIRIHRKEYYAKNKDRITIKHRAYNISHKKEFAEYRSLHRDEANEYAKNYRKENADRLIKYREENKDKIKKRHQEYLQSKKGKANNQKKGHKYRALKNNATIEDFSPTEVFERDGYICQICHKKTRPDFKNPNHPLYPNLDHLIPLSKGGDHSRLNTQCLCRQCNITKQANEKFGDQLRLFG